MKALVVYFTMGGRTKKIAKAIAGTLTNFDVEFISFELIGNIPKKLKILEKFENGDFSIIINELNSLSRAEFDLLLIGMPTHGNLPPKGFDQIISSLGDLTGKKVVAFNTARMTGEQTLEIMETKLQEVGAEVIHKRRFKGFARLGVKEAIDFGKLINETIF